MSKDIGRGSQRLVEVVAMSARKKRKMSALTTEPLFVVSSTEQFSKLPKPRKPAFAAIVNALTPCNLVRL